MKAKQLRELSAEELNLKKSDLQKEIASMRLRKASGADVEKYGKIRGMRREVARINTIITEREKQ